MKRIIIEIGGDYTYEDACRYVADQFEMGYTNGILGASGDEFWVED